MSALPWTALRSLLPSGSAIKNRVSSIASSSILSVHLLCDTKLFEHPTGFVGLLDSPVHWIFDRSHTLPEALRGQQLYAIIVSAADDWMPLKQDAITERLRNELTRYFPVAATMGIERALIYKSKDATFAARPATESHRPETLDAPWENVRLAGDWVRTGLPGTIESAALSAQLAVASLDVQPGPARERAV